jgi:septum site-determining protein MinC
VLSPKLPLSGWPSELDRWLTRSPGFFARTLVVIDVAGLKLTKLKLRDLVGELERRKMGVLGVEGADPSWSEDDLPPLLRTEQIAASRGSPERDSSAALLSTVVSGVKASLLLEEPLRSGQSILHGGDVIVVGSVASGAEIIVAGSVHVYGPYGAGYSPEKAGTRIRKFSAVSSRPSSSRSTGTTAWR